MKKELKNYNRNIRIVYYINVVCSIMSFLLIGYALTLLI